MQDRTVPERLATLEANYPELKADVTEIKADVKTLLAAHNRQSGAIRLGSLLWSALIGAAGAVGGYFAARGH